MRKIGVLARRREFTCYSPAPCTLMARACSIFKEVDLGERLHDLDRFAGEIDDAS